MRRTTTVGVMLLLTLSSSVAFGLARRHGAWDGVLAGKGGSKIKGEIGMVGGKVAGTTDVDVKLTGDIAGSARPWHVHVGSCAKGGPVYGDAKAYGLLRVSAKGTADGKATLRVALPDSGYFYVNIHESATNMSQIVACGDLLLEE